mmetsp:Transcript_71268/g.208913  ORF Transcript_71268/g.208913 Transcript_71268/m.208913 type:complete len:476 (-) Transcript_71268:158-1585(-)
MLAVITLRAENCTIFWGFKCWKTISHSLAASLDNGTPMSLFPHASASVGAVNSSPLHCAAKNTSESHGMGELIPTRAAVCANAIADGSLSTAALTIRRSAWYLKGMYCSAAPVCLATCTAKSTSAFSSSAAYLKACGLAATHFKTNPLSALRSGAAPFIAAPLVFTEARTKSLSALSWSLAPASAVPLTAIAWLTKPRSSFSAGAASPRYSPSYFTASSTSDLSARSSSGASMMAAPRLMPTAAKKRSRSDWTSGGAAPSCVQSLRTMARQLAWRKLLRLTLEGPGASPRAEDRISFRSAAWKMEFRISATPPRPDSSGVARTFSFWAAKVALKVSSSSSGRSFDSLKSLMSLSGVLPLIISEALAPDRKIRLGMPIVIAATRSSKSMSLSTLMKAASHFSAPHSTRFSLSRGVRISVGGVSLWYFRYSSSFASSAFLKGTWISPPAPCSAASLKMFFAAQRASASTSRASPSED